MRFQLSDSWSAHDFVGAATQFYDGKVECVCNPGELCIVTLANGLNPDYLQKMRQNRLAYAIGNGYSFCFSSFVSAGRAPSWSKLLLLAALHGRCASTMWIDADAVFTSTRSLAPVMRALGQHSLLMASQPRGCRKNNKEPGESLPMTPNFKDILQAAGECEASCSKAEVLDASPTSPQPVVLQPMWLSALNRENSTSASAAHDTRGSAPAPQGASGRFVSVLHV